MRRSLLVFVRASAVLVTVIMLLSTAACGGGGSESKTASATKASDVTLSWTKSQHSTTNSPGSGYTVYYSASAGVEPDDAGVSAIDVPYDSDLGKTPTTVVIENLTTGQWYFRVQAYSSLSTASRGAEQLTSALSPESSFKAP